MRSNGVLQSYTIILLIAKNAYSRIYLGDPLCPHYDFYFDRVIATERINNENKTIMDSIATAVYIDTERILTSYNPHRELSRTPIKNLDGIFQVETIFERIVKNGSRFDNARQYKVRCGRQVVPIRDSQIRTNQWHGTERENSPVHDLMVLRIESSVEFIKKTSFYDYTLDLSVTIGPQKAILAEIHDTLEGTLKIATMGSFATSGESQNSYVCSTEYEDDVLVDCNEWMPKDWGHMICLLDEKGLNFIGSGAVLACNDKVFGIGSFYMRKGKEGILVFTDVRPYAELINNTCTEEDQI